LTNARIAAVDLRRPDLRVAFPRHFRARLTGQTVLSLRRRAKYLLAHLSSSETLLMHLGMSGSFRIDRHAGSVIDADSDRASEPERHDHVVFRMSPGAVITFYWPSKEVSPGATG
jgi:formamidopyrimidine-DNA glycosylase